MTGSTPGCSGNLLKTSSPSTSAVRSACIDALRAGSAIASSSSLIDAGVRVLEPIEQHADHAHARGDHAGAVAGVHALGEQRHLEVADHEAAQRRGRPQLVVVRAARVEADDERQLADARREVIDVRGQVVAAATPRTPRSARRSARAGCLSLRSALIAVSDAKIA